MQRRMELPVLNSQCGTISNESEGWWRVSSLCSRPRSSDMDPPRKTMHARTTQIRIAQLLAMRSNTRRTEGAVACDWIERFNACNLWKVSHFLEMTSSKSWDGWAERLLQASHGCKTNFATLLGVAQIFGTVSATETEFPNPHDHADDDDGWERNNATTPGNRRAV